MYTLYKTCDNRLVNALTWSRTWYIGIWNMKRKTRTCRAHTQKNVGKKKRTNLANQSYNISIDSETARRHFKWLIACEKKNASTSCRRTTFAQEKNIRNETERKKYRISSACFFFSFCNKKKKCSRCTFGLHFNGIKSIIKLTIAEDQWISVIGIIYFLIALKRTHKYRLETAKHISKLSDRWPLHPPHDANSWLFHSIWFRFYSPAIST